MPNAKTINEKLAHKTTAGFRLANIGWLALSLIAIAIDQYTKYLASTHLTYGEPVPVMPMLNWTLLHNYGAAFSFLSDAGGWQRWFFTALALAVSLVITVWLLRLKSNMKTLAAALALILGGALGNLIDRLSLGYVVDFIHVYYQNWHYPAFNIADSAITLGVVLLIVDMLFLERKRIG